MKKKIPTETEVILLRWRMVRGPNILKGKIGEPPKGNIIKNQNNWVSIHSYVSCMACDETQLDSRQCSLVMMRQKKSLIFKLVNNFHITIFWSRYREEVFLSRWSYDRKFSTSQITKNTWGENYVAYIFRSWIRILSGWTKRKFPNDQNHWKCTTKNIWVRFNSG